MTVGNGVNCSQRQKKFAINKGKKKQWGKNNKNKYNTPSSILSLFLCYEALILPGKLRQMHPYIFNKQILMRIILF